MASKKINQVELELAIAMAQWGSMLSVNSLILANPEKAKDSWAKELVSASGEQYNDLLRKLKEDKNG